MAVGLISSLVQLRSGLFSAQHVSQTAQAMDPGDLDRRQARRLGKRAEASSRS